MKRGLLGVAAVLLGLIIPTPAHGLESSEVFTVFWDKETTADYPPIPANNPAFVANPPHCQVFPDCTLVPITIVHQPGDKLEDDFIVQLTVSWPDVPENEVSGANDIDVYVWDAEKEYAVEDEPVGKSAGADNPEVAKVYRPVKQHYWLAVNNLTGPNLGFTVSAKYIKYPGSTPFELLEPPSALEGPQDDAPPVDRSLDVVPAEPGLGEPVDLARLPVTDPAFDFARPPDAAALTAPPPPEPSSLVRTEPDEPSGVALAIALGLVPAGLLGTGALVLLRRRPAILRIR